jgi:alpha-maltose-1-phosphate synthase
VPTPQSHPSALRVCVLTETDPADASLISGMPARIVAALQRRIPHLTVLWPIPPPPDRATPVPPAAGRLRRRLLGHASDLAERARPARTYASTIAAARALSRDLDRALRAVACDAVVCPVAAGAMLELRTDRPILYFSDTTAALLARDYHDVRRRGSGFIRAIDEIERVAITRADLRVFASERARRSAVDDYGAPEHATRTLPMGASVTPTPEQAAALAFAPPTREAFRIAIFAADPARKRLDLAVRAVEALERTGVNAELHIVGPPTRAARRSRVSRLYPPLSAGRPDELARLREILASCHAMILPSRAETFGIAPAEAAHFAVPSVVSDAGGLPSVVLDEQTGVVLPVAAGPDAYAAALRRFVDEPDRYVRLAKAARARAITDLTWDAFAARLVAELESLVAQTARRSPAPAPLPPTAPGGGTIPPP